MVGPRGEYLVARAQRFNVDTNLPTTVIDELGNPKHAGTINDIPEVTATLQIMDVSHKLFAVLTGNDPGAYPSSGVDISDLNEVDLIVVVRDENIADYAKTMHLRRCRVQSFNWSYSVTGEATEEYTFGGTERRWFRASSDVVVDTFGAGSSHTLSQTPIQLKNGNYLISFIQDGEYLKEVASTSDDDEYSVSGTTVSPHTATTNYAVAVYQAAPSGNNWSDVSDDSIPVAIRGKNIPVYIGVNQIERVQSVTIRGDLRTDRIEEMGNPNVVGYIAQVPTVTGDLQVLDTDHQLVALLTTGSMTSTDTEFELCEYTASGLYLEIRLQDPTDGCGYATANTVKTVYIPEIKITGDTHTSQVGNSVTLTFNWESATGECYVYSGLRT